MTYVEFPLKDTGFPGPAGYPVTYEDVRFYAGMFPGLDVEQEFRNMAVWLHGNPDRRKTRRGIKRFISHWLIASSKEDHVTTKGCNRRSFDAPTLETGWATVICPACGAEASGKGYGDCGIFCSQECERLHNQKLARGSR